MKKTRKAIAQAETKPMVAPRAVKNPLMNSVISARNPFSIVLGV